jgi:hypothetical protein
MSAIVGAIYVFTAGSGLLALARAIYSNTFRKGR